MAAKVIWAAVIINEDKNVIAIEPLKIKCKNKFGEVETITVGGVTTDTDTFLQKSSALVSYSKEIKEIYETK
jgi:hypothetical protein